MRVSKYQYYYALTGGLIGGIFCSFLSKSLQTKQDSNQIFTPVLGRTINDNNLEYILLFQYV